MLAVKWSKIIWVDFPLFYSLLLFFYLTRGPSISVFSGQQRKNGKDYHAAPSTSSMIFYRTKFNPKAIDFYMMRLLKVMQNNSNSKNAS